MPFGHAQACKVAGGQQAFEDGLLPQLLPIFHCQAELRAAYGAAYQPAIGSSSADADSLHASDAEAAAHADSGFWDLAYILYPEAVDTVGLAEARDVVPGWAALEHTLKVRLLHLQGSLPGCGGCALVCTC